MVVKINVETNPPTTVKRIPNHENIQLLLEAGQKDWWSESVVLVAYSIPKVSNRIERLMGTNIIRGTDRKYMGNLRRRIEEDYQDRISSRNVIRMIKEDERNQNVILDGKSNIIPKKLADHPIFVENRRVKAIIKERRKNLKTTHEKNADVLVRKGLKYERERLYYENLEIEEMLNIREHREEQKQMEEEFMEEDYLRGLDLLRIENENWRPCEMDLRRFLIDVHNKHKKRSLMVPKRHISDKKDIEYKQREIDRARFMKFKLEKAKKNARTTVTGQPHAIYSEDNVFKQLNRKHTTLKEYLAEAPMIEPKISTVDSVISVQSTSEIEESHTSSDEIRSHRDTDSTAESSDFARVMDGMQKDTNDGIIMSHEKYVKMQCISPALVRLKNTQNLSELYEVVLEILQDIPEYEEEDVYDAGGGEEGEELSIDMNQYY